MCGINGIIAYAPGAPRVDADEVKQVRDSMAKRGPDGAGFWMSPDGRVGFGHRRLAIIDLSADGDQPMASSDGRLTITFNGEIYNYQELREGLMARGHRFRTKSDTEVILAMYAEYGAQMVPKLRGMFALAIWDSDKQELVLARDAMGIKPLYLADNGSTLRFASQVKALLGGSGVDTSPEPAGHVGFFLWGHVPEPYTLYRGIRQLPAGCCAIVNADGVVTSEPLFDSKAALQPGTGSYDQAYLREVLEDSVSHHFIADVPVSLFLSAGRDSATLLALAAETRDKPVHAVTLAFEEYAGTPNDESVLAAEIARLCHADHLVHQVSSEEFRDDIDALLTAMDQPSIDGANTYFVCKVANQLGVRVSLSGLGADEIFGGYPSFIQIPKLAGGLGWSAGMPALGRGFRSAVSGLGLKSKTPKFAGLLEYGGSIEGAYLLRRGLFMPWELPSILDHDLLQEGLEELATMDRLRAITSGLPNDYTKVVALESQVYMGCRLLRDSDWASMAHSLELRVPFVDIELARRLGPWIGSSEPPTKDAMARCPRIKLPQEVLNRPKTGFNVPIAEWALELEPGTQQEHSWRHWARYVYKQQSGGDHLFKKVPAAV